TAQARGTRDPVPGCRPGPPPRAGSRCPSLPGMARHAGIPSSSRLAPCPRTHGGAPPPERNQLAPGPLPPSRVRGTLVMSILDESFQSRLSRIRLPTFGVAAPMTSTADAQVRDALAQQTIEVPSWAFGNSGTRFKVFSQPGVPRDPKEKIADAAQVHAYTGAAPRVSLHIPWDLVDDFDDLAAYARDLGVQIGMI